MASTPPGAARAAVVGPIQLGRGNLSVLRIIPIWIASAVIHAAMLVLAFFVFSALDGRANADVLAPEVTSTTEVEEPVHEPDLTVTDLGLDDALPAGLMLERISDLVVPGQVEPTEPPGIEDAPRDAPRQSLPVPPGAGEGTGRALLLPDAPGAGGLYGTLGGDGAVALRGAFGGRGAATKDEALRAGGGNKISEAAVARGLEWLALHQSQEGRWGLHDFNRCAREKPYPAGKTFTCNCDGAVSRRNDIAATGLALLPFLGAGVTHKATATRKDYTKTVDAGLKYLMSKQAKDGCFSGDMYAHGIATIALCEAFGMTSDPRLKVSAQAAINFIVAAQDTSGGGWRYSPRTPGDTSVTGWQLMALKSGQMSGLSVPRTALNLCERYLDSCESATRGRYTYMPGGEPTATMTAVALLCRQYLGISPRNPGLLSGVDYLKSAPPGATNNLYYEYYATQVLHHMGGESWRFWNEGKDGRPGIRDSLIARQDHSTAARQHIEGSWPATDVYAAEGGRIMTTSLALLCLEVYYRHLPLYRRDLGVVKPER